MSATKRMLLMASMMAMIAEGNQRMVFEPEPRKLPMDWERKLCKSCSRLKSCSKNIFKNPKQKACKEYVHR